MTMAAAPGENDDSPGRSNPNGHPMRSNDAQNQRTEFYLMRHAPTEWNAAGRIQGQADSPLTATGRQWADGWGPQLAGFAMQRVLTSDSGY